MRTKSNSNIHSILYTDQNRTKPNQFNSIQFQFSSLNEIDFQNDHCVSNHFDLFSRLFFIHPSIHPSFYPSSVVSSFRCCLLWFILFLFFNYTHLLLLHQFSYTYRFLHVLLIYIPLSIYFLFIVIILFLYPIISSRSATASGHQ